MEGVWFEVVISSENEDAIQPALYSLELGGPRCKAAFSSI